MAPEAPRSPRRAPRKAPSALGRGSRAKWGPPPEGRPLPFMDRKSEVRRGTATSPRSRGFLEGTSEPTFARGPTGWPRRQAASRKQALCEAKGGIGTGAWSHGRKGLARPLGSWLQHEAATAPGGRDKRRGRVPRGSWRTHLQRAGMTKKHSTVGGKYPPLPPSCPGSCQGRPGV